MMERFISPAYMLAIAKLLVFDDICKYLAAKHKCW
jgi:hypothetical protein